jgi:hypothetical protein
VLVLAPKNDARQPHAKELKDPISKEYMYGIGDAMDHKSEGKCYSKNLT